MESLYEEIKSRSNSWVEVTDNDTSNRSGWFNISVSPRRIGNVHIIDNIATVDVFGKFPRSIEHLSRLKNITADLTLVSNVESVIENGKLYLNCSRINFTTFKPTKTSNDEFEVYCASNDWSGIFTVQPSDGAEIAINEFKVPLWESVQDYELGFIVNRTVVTLFPLGVYFILSLLVWLVFRATAFVRAG
ncbi:hypothetical protein ACNSPG_22470 (plasmid) [Brucella pituitosa]|uniref:hypothetical protein n=1 Tax=Brucella pituitosa TaxID=571256 RepID=UPI003C736716